MTHHTCPLMNERSKPAYPGARFDANGFCVNHPTTRLCKLTDEGKFKIVRKTCHRCGAAGLMSEARTAKTNAHGYKVKEAKHREIQGLLTASGVDPPHHKHTSVAGHRHHGRSHIGPKSQSARGLDSRGERSAKVIPRQDSQGTKGDMSSDDSHTRGNESGDSRVRTTLRGEDVCKSPRRSRTLSPARRLDGSRRGRTLSPVRQIQMPEKSKVTSSYIKKVSEEFQLSPKHVKMVISSKLTRSPKVLPPFDKKGFCIHHSDVQLAKKDQNGIWRAIQGVCPECVETNKLRRSKISSSTKSGKVSRAIKQLKITEGSGNPTAITTGTEAALVPVDQIKSRSEKFKHPSESTGAIVVQKTENMLVISNTPSNELVKVKEAKSPRIIKKTNSTASLTSVTNSPNSDTSHPSPAFSCVYFSGTQGFPALPLISDELNMSYADTIKHSNTLVANKRSGAKPRVSKLDG